MLTMAMMMMLMQAPAVVPAAAQAPVKAEEPVKAEPQKEEKAGPELTRVKTVYLLTMSKGLDQFLANELTRRRVVQVVTDPQKADALITDAVGPALERAFERLYPAPKPVEEPKKKKDEDDEEDKKASFEVQGGMKDRPVSTFSRGKGTIFLVSRETRNVLWSLYERPRSSRPDELDVTSKIVARELKGALKAARREAAGKRWFQF